MTRTRLLVIPVVLSLLVGIGVWTVLRHRRHEAAAQLAASYDRGRSALDALRFAPPLTDDPTGTACELPVDRCARTTVSPRAALETVSGSLRQAGLAPGAVACGRDAERPSTDCVVTSTDGRTQVIARASDRVRDPYHGTEHPVGSTGVSLWTEVVDPEAVGAGEVVANAAGEDGAADEPRLSAPLPPATEVIRLPAGWPALPCLRPAADGCHEYGGYLTLPGAAPDEIQALVDQVVASKLRLAAVGGGYVSGRLYRGPDRSDPVMFSAVLKARADGRTMGTVHIGDGSAEHATAGDQLPHLVGTTP